MLRNWLWWTQQRGEIGFISLYTKRKCSKGWRGEGVHEQKIREKCDRCSSSWQSPHDSDTARPLLYWVWCLFLDDSCFLLFLLFHPHHTQPVLIGFIFSLRLCTPLVHSFPDSSYDVSLFISLMNPLAFVLYWFIHSQNSLWLQFAHKSFSYSLSAFLLLSFSNSVNVSL